MATFDESKHPRKPAGTEAGGEFTSAETFGGWRTSGSGIEYGKIKPVTRGASTYHYLVGADGKERRFKDSGPKSGEDSLQRALEKRGFVLIKPGKK